MPHFSICLLHYGAVACFAFHSDENWNLIGLNSLNRNIMDAKHTKYTDRMHFNSAIISLIGFVGPHKTNYMVAIMVNGNSFCYMKIARANRSQSFNRYREKKERIQ